MLVTHHRGARQLLSSFHRSCARLASAMAEHPSAVLVAAHITERWNAHENAGAGMTPRRRHTASQQTDILTLGASHIPPAR